MSTSGRLRYSGEKIKSIDAPVKKIDVSELKSGMYFLRIDGKHSELKKFLKL